MAAKEHFDLIVRNATIIDGTRAPGYEGDIAVRDSQREAALAVAELTAAMDEGEVSAEELAAQQPQGAANLIPGMPPEQAAKKSGAKSNRAAKGTGTTKSKKATGSTKATKSKKAAKSAKATKSAKAGKIRPQHLVSSGTIARWHGAIEVPEIQARMAGVGEETASYGRRRGSSVPQAWGYKSNRTSRPRYWLG